MEARIRDNQIILPIGTAITFKMVAKNEQKIDLKLVESEENSKFFALFDENDVDFEIEVNNKKCVHGVGYTLIVNNGYYDYYVGAGELWSMETLYTKGRKLHFICENSEEGQNVIKQTAEEFDITYSESAAVCSRIEFNLEVEKVKQKPIQRFRGGGGGGGEVLFGSSQINNSLPSFGSFGSLSTKVAKKSKLVRSGSDVPDSLVAPPPPPPPTPNVLEHSSGSLSATSEPLGSSVRSLNATTFGRACSLAAKWSPSEEERSQTNSETQIGDKGVVCFGEQSNQYYNEYNGFTKDKNLEIKGFVVELRFSKKA